MNSPSDFFFPDFGQFYTFAAIIVFGFSCALAILTNREARLEIFAAFNPFSNQNKPLKTAAMTAIIFPVLLWGGPIAFAIAELVIIMGLAILLFRFVRHRCSF